MKAGDSIEFRVRPAHAGDARAATLTLRRSIAELCHADHGGDAAEIAKWTANKTESAWAAWLARPDAALLVAEGGGAILGVGMVDARGEILLNYVSPEARLNGVSTALLAALEETARGWGCSRCTLGSTITARGFYARRGYRAEAPEGLRMVKAL